MVCKMLSDVDIGKSTCPTSSSKYTLKHLQISFSDLVLVLRIQQNINMNDLLTIFTPASFALLFVVFKLKKYFWSAPNKKNKALFNDCCEISYSEGASSKLLQVRTRNGQSSLDMSPSPSFHPKY